MTVSGEIRTHQKEEDIGKIIRINWNYQKIIGSILFGLGFGGFMGTVSYFVILQGFSEPQQTAVDFPTILTLLFFTVSFLFGVWFFINGLMNLLYASIVCFRALNNENLFWIDTAWTMIGEGKNEWVYLNKDASYKIFNNRFSTYYIVFFEYSSANNPTACCTIKSSISTIYFSFLSFSLFPRKIFVIPCSLLNDGSRLHKKISDIITQK